jgi:hypothetical protein
LRQLVIDGKKFCEIICQKTSAFADGFQLRLRYAGQVEGLNIHKETAGGGKYISICLYTYILL